MNKQQIRSFTVSEWYEIKGRGIVAAIDRMPEGEYDPNNFKGQIVNLGGKQYKVKGVESFAIGRSEDSPYRLGFGLLVEAVEGDK